MPLTEVQLSYIAGLFDGEGSVVITRRRTRGKHGFLGWNYYGAISIANSNLPCLELAKEVTGGNICKSATNLNYQVYNLQLSNVKADNFAKIISPYSIVKKKELEVLMSFREVQYELGKKARIYARWDLDKYKKYTEQSEDNYYACKAAIDKTRKDTRLCL